MVRQQADEHRLSGAVGTEDGRVLALADRQPQSVQHAAIAFDDGRIEELENGLLGTWLRGVRCSRDLRARRPAPDS